MPELSPQTPCDTCAFGKAGGATEPHNRLKGQICALGGLPFFCHHAPDGRELDWHGDSADYFRSLRNKKDRRVCAGWKREVRAYRSRGFLESTASSAARWPRVHWIALWSSWPTIPRRRRSSRPSTISGAPCDSW